MLNRVINHWIKLSTIRIVIVDSLIQWFMNLFSSNHLAESYDEDGEIGALIYDQVMQRKQVSMRCNESKSQ